MKYSQKFTKKIVFLGKPVFVNNKYVRLQIKFKDEVTKVPSYDEITRFDGMCEVKKILMDFLGLT
jgi:hypothetical protein